MSQVPTHTQAQGVTGYNYGYLDEQTKRMIRRALLKAVAIPGYQVPFGGREMPMPYGWEPAAFRSPQRSSVKPTR
ncbi:PhnJ protein [Vibrio maritimus]|uniref:PhnJ protein n=1 Tax=Vibrio maritimus TaxID=990268 RepID=A0A090T6T6_9VIBR|nr:PhnJ protein [Vibrio maritimus]